MDTSRVSQQSLFDKTFNNLSASLARYQTLQQQLSSGKIMSRPSDSPQGIVSSLRFRGEGARVQQFAKNIDDGMSWLGVADTTLQSVVAQTQRVRDLVIQGQNGSLSPGDRNAIADEVDQLRESLLGLGNTQYLGRPIFGGTSASPVAFDNAGAFVGNTGAVTRSIGFNQTVDVNILGTDVFGDTVTGLFATLTQISNDLRSNVTNLPSDLGALDTSLTLIHNAQSTVGARYNRLQNMQSRNDDLALQIRQGLSDIEDVDLSKTIIDLKTQEIAYQAALAATSKVITPSLVDFLR